MKKITLAVLAMLWCSSAYGTPYFRPLDLKHLQISAGAFVDPTSGDTDFGSMLAIFTHSPADGSITGTNTVWTPLAIGGGWNGTGNGFMAVGPSANFAPVAKALLLKGLELATKEDRYMSLKSLLSPKTEDGPDITCSFGPSVLVNLIEGGDFVAIKRWRAQTRIFAGAAWGF